MLSDITTTTMFTVSLKVLFLLAVCLPADPTVLFRVDAGFVNISASGTAPPFNRSNFPSDFLFGTASSAYQYEGAAAEGGKGPSIWDTFTKIPGKISDGGSGSVALDEYHRYKEDVQIMKDMGLDAFRLSILWSRILPNGKVSGGVNEAGVTYYNNLIDELLSNGIKPFVTPFHWNLPQALEDEYEGFLSRKIVIDFGAYADICFKLFGDRVKHWITLNEPYSFSFNGYGYGNLAPGRYSKSANSNCTKGDSSTEPYLVSHNQLLAHASAVKVYRKKYQEKQKGIIGIALVALWYVPYSKSKHDFKARQQALDFAYGWFMNPLTKGEYPKSMKLLVGNRLPKFSKEESELVKGSFDFLNLNYYTSIYAANTVNSQNVTWYLTDSRANFSRMSEENNEEVSLEHALADVTRIYYYHRHLDFLNKAIRKGANVKGYFAWSLLNNFEWTSGYSVGFGINYVDYKNGLKRYPKHSVH